MEDQKDLSDIELIVQRNGGMSWIRRAELVEEYHQRRQKSEGAAKVGRPDSVAKRQGWSIRDTARALRLSIGGVCDDLRLAKLIKERPEIALKERKEALKFLPREEQKLSSS